MHALLRGIVTLAKTATMSKICHRGVFASYVSGGLLRRSNLFPVKIYTISGGIWCVERQIESQNLTPFVKMAKNLP